MQVVPHPVRLAWKVAQVKQAETAAAAYTASVERLLEAQQMR
ncbi:MAG: hypothetical protein ACK4V6_14020 [Microthrixaceae bacterium]